MINVQGHGRHLQNPYSRIENYFMVTTQDHEELHEELSSMKLDTAYRQVGRRKVLNKLMLELSRSDNHRKKYLNIGS